MRVSSFPYAILVTCLIHFILCVFITAIISSSLYNSSKSWFDFPIIDRSITQRFHEWLDALTLTGMSVGEDRFVGRAVSYEKWGRNMVRVYRCPGDVFVSGYVGGYSTLSSRMSQVVTNPQGRFCTTRRCFVRSTYG